MLDLTKLDLTEAPWEIRRNENGDVFEIGGVYATSRFDRKIHDERNILAVTDADARLVAASYEMLSNTIEDTLALEPFDDGDQDNPVVRIVERNIEFLERLLGLTWSEVKQRLGIA